MTRLSQRDLARLGIEEPAKRNKFGAKKRTINGIEFDSKAEADYYLLLIAKEQAGEIESFQVQPRYLLQEKFEKAGKTYRPIEYIADFEVHHKDGRVEVIDIKGITTEVFAIKRKMFEHQYPQYHLSVLKHVTRMGGWIELDDYHKRKRAEKAAQVKLETQRIPRKRKEAKKS